MQEPISRRERKKLQVRNTIVDIALKLFFEKGFAETSISEIMEVADLGTGTFYNYFDSKEDILQYCITQEISKTEDILRGILQSSTDATRKLSEMLIVIGGIYQKNRQLFSLYLQFNKSGHHTRRQPPHGPLFKEILAKVIKEGQEHQEFRKDIPQDIIAEMFMSLIQSALASRSEISFAENLRCKLDLFLFGLTNKDDNH
ncbi:TetR/AcrR family transcriptional regulator [Syntrophomonas curvata]